MDCFRVEFAEARLPLHVAGHPPLQAVEFEQGCHKADLVERRLQEKGAEIEQPLIRQGAATVQIAAPELVGAGQRGQIGVAVACKSSRYRPQAMPVDAGFDQIGMGEKPADAAVAVQKGVDPGEPMVARGGGYDPVDGAQVLTAVDSSESVQELGQLLEGSGVCVVPRKGAACLAVKNIGKARHALQ